jgi:NAD(P)-dependent dehydrogenase (short-subunit alcohol dehydrogenase family)
MTEHGGASRETSLHGQVVYVASSGVDLGSVIAAGLYARGAAVALLTDAPQPPAVPLPNTVPRIEASFASRGSLEKAFAQAAECVGPADQVVHSAMPPLALESQDLVSMSDERWSACCRAALKATLYCLQAAHTSMNRRGGSIVLIGPSLSLAGAPGLVPLSAAVEGQRGLAKSSARQWGRLGLTVNWIAAAPRSLSPLFAQASLPVKPDPVPVAFGRPLDLQSEIVPIIEFLGTKAGRAMTGATLVLDGGEWMVP